MPACALCGIFYGGRGGGDMICSNCHRTTHEEVQRRNPRPAVPPALTAQSYVAARTFTVNGTEMTIRAGERVRFDGTWATFQGQAPRELQLRGAITVGWLVAAPPLSGAEMMAEHRGALLRRPRETTAQVLVEDKPVGEPFKIQKPTKVERVRPSRYSLLGDGGLDLEDE